MENLSIFVSQNLVFCLSFILLLAVYIIFELTQSKQAKISITSEMAVREVNKTKGIYIDIRSNEEFSNSHINQAINIPVENIESHLKKLAKYKEKAIVLYDNTSTSKTREALKIFQMNDFKNTFILEGGIKAWIEAYLPIKSNKR